MASSVDIAAPLWADGETFTGLLGRTEHIAASFLNENTSAQVIGGVLPSGGALVVSAGSGMHVAVASGYAVIPSSAGSTSGGYLVASMASTTLDVATSDPVNPRIDLVCATVSDTGSPSDTWLLQVVTGTPAGSPAAPSLPTYSIPLATVLVPASSSSVTGGHITDERTWVAAHGGIVPVTDLVSGYTAAGGYEGLYIHDRSTERLARLGPAGNVKQVVVLPWEEMATYIDSGPLTMGQGTFADIAAILGVVTSGEDIEITATWKGFYHGGFPATPITGIFRLQVSGNSLCVMSTVNFAADGTERGGGTMNFRTGFNSDTPVAGSHTITLQARCPELASASVYSGTLEPIVLRVKPVTL